MSTEFKIPLDLLTALSADVSSRFEQDDIVAARFVIDGCHERMVSELETVNHFYGIRLHLRRDKVKKFSFRKGTFEEFSIIFARNRKRYSNHRILSSRRLDVWIWRYKNLNAYRMKTPDYISRYWKDEIFLQF
ncbi:hypothetical protein Nepgr_000932 [Nepenthes gracilis]|uniref:Uncharacterized protein n=1 Tax=Nepenthes gracilis TaxID=150966 RepID=A0AAD3P653_NEPGR|nr:hypothetical protein Nepgr_000932 [Nepenthes gracilis]